MKHSKFHLLIPILISFFGVISCKGNVLSSSSKSMESDGISSQYSSISQKSSKIESQAESSDSSSFSLSLSEFEQFLKEHPEYQGTEEEWAQDVTDGNNCKLYGHAYVKDVHEPTYTEKGFDQYTCEECGETYIDNYVDILPHTHDYIRGTCSICGEKKYSSGLKFEMNKDGNSYTLAGMGTCKDAEVVIPETYNGLPVSVIGAGSLSGQKEIKTVVMPDSVTIVEDHAFYDSTNIYEIYLSPNITILGAYAFSEIKRLGWIDLPEALIEIEEYCFTGCDNLEAPELPHHLTTIKDQAMSYCYTFETITIPESVTTMGISVFSWDNGMTDIYCEAESIPDGWDTEWTYGCNANIHWGQKQKA